MDIIARFVTRPDGDGGCDILLGAMIKNQNRKLEPNCIYEIREIFGELVILKVGESLVSENSVYESPLRVTWHQEYQQVGIIAGKYLLVSREEFEKMTENKFEL